MSLNTAKPKKKLALRAVGICFAVAVTLAVLGGIATYHPANAQNGQQGTFELPTWIASAVTKDPFSRHTWHAINQTWPGTINFDAKTNRVVLKPVGVPEIEGDYSFTLKHSSSSNLAMAKVIEGTLKMTNTIGQVSESNFRILDGKNLTLIYPSGQRPEEYIRMSDVEERSETARLEQMLRDGKISKVVPPGYR